jgi:hypothetical protein
MDKEKWRGREEVRKKEAEEEEDDDEAGEKEGRDKQAV